MAGKGNIENLKPFQPGQSGNPGGKPVNTRNEINSAFLRDIAKDYHKVEAGQTEPNGPRAIKEAREKDPVSYVRALMALQPKQIEPTIPMDDMTDDQLRAAVARLQSLVAAEGAGSGAEAKGQPPQTH